MFEDSHHLNKQLKNLLNNWNYKITNRPLMKRQAVVTTLTERFTQPSIDNEPISSSLNSFTQPSIDNEQISSSLNSFNQVSRLI